MVSSVYRKTWTGRAGCEGPVSTDPRWTVGVQKEPSAWAPGAFGEFAGWRTEEAPRQEPVGVRRQSVRDIRVQKGMVLTRAGNVIAERKV